MKTTLLVKLNAHGEAAYEFLVNTRDEAMLAVQLNMR